MSTSLFVAVLLTQAAALFLGYRQGVRTERRRVGNLFEDFGCEKVGNDTGGRLLSAVLRGDKPKA